MKVLIVAKTRRGSRACVGGITFDGLSVRLVAANAETNEHAGMEYGVGEVWEVEGLPDPAIVAPHTENLIVHARRRLGPMTDPIPFIERLMPPRSGGIDVLFDGFPQAARYGALYVAQRSGVPAYSTMFWRPDRPLARRDSGKGSRYVYPTPEGEASLAFVGFQEPPDELPAGTLLRVSLAHWWRPDGEPQMELRCYVQLSGWFPYTLGARLPPDAPVRAAQPARGAAPAEAGLSNAGLAPDAAADHSLPAAAAPADMDAARRLLKTVFGYDTFRPLQPEIIANLLAGRDTLAVMPTGSGKSLCYQLPALLLPGMTVVVSPLIALMQDQVDQLAETGVAAVFLNSSLEYRDYAAAVRRVRQGEIKLLYTSPETLLAPATLAMLDRCQVACLAIDEAHCISEWGHDFRPEYRELLAVRRRYSQAVCVAFTATATPRVQRDIKATLGFRDENEFIASFDRPNLYLEVQPRVDGLGQALAFLKDHRDQSGIIYCSKRQEVETLAAQLQARGWSALPYHAGMDDETRRRHQTLFSRDQAPIIIATIAFGMGINKSNVRFVLHYNLPQSLERYYQEIGRSGRDGLRADCLLLHSRSDLQTMYHFIESGAEQEQAGRRARLQAMARYAEAEDCRRRILLEYFGEAVSADQCGFCDNCLAENEPREQVEITGEAQKFLLCVKLTGQVFGVTHIVNVLRGSLAQDVLRRRHDQLPCYGAGKDRSAVQWKGWAEELIRKNLLIQDMEHGGLRLTDAGRKALNGERVFVTAERLRPTAPRAAADYDPDLFELLRGLRRRLAEAKNVPPYVIFSDRSLQEMAACYPQSIPSFLAIHGVGQRKLDQYGEAFLEILRAYCGERNLAERAPAAPSPAGARPETGARRRWMEVGALFAAGRSVPEIAALYDVQPNTVIQHLGRCVFAGQRFDPARLAELSTLSAEDQARVLSVMQKLGPTYLRPIYDALEEAISFDELHILRLYYICSERSETQ